MTDKTITASRFHPQRPFTCTWCGMAGEGGPKKTRHDGECKRLSDKAHKNAQRVRNGTEPVGAIKECKNCGLVFAKTHKRQCYCLPCSELSSKDNIPAYRPRQSKYQSARNKVLRRTVPTFAVRERMSANINNSLRDGKGGRSWEALVDYTLADLMHHLERQFTKGMTWENRAAWHIDHITPLSSFDITGPDCPEFKAAWCLSNLRPLWAIDNIRKSATRTHLI